MTSAFERGFAGVVVEALSTTATAGATATATGGGDWVSATCVCGAKQLMKRASIFACLGRGSPGLHPSHPTATRRANGPMDDFYTQFFDSQPVADAPLSEHCCPICFKEFPRGWNLKSHLASHDPHQPYACMVCGVRFRRSHDFTRHLKTHINPTEHHCKRCGKVFTRKDALRRHEKMPIERQAVYCYRPPAVILPASPDETISSPSPSA